MSQVKKSAGSTTGPGTSEIFACGIAGPITAAERGIPVGSPFEGRRILTNSAGETISEEIVDAEIAYGHVKAAQEGSEQ